MEIVMALLYPPELKDYWVELESRQLLGYER